MPVGAVVEEAIVGRCCDRRTPIGIRHLELKVCHLARRRSQDKEQDVVKDERDDL